MLDVVEVRTSLGSLLSMPLEDPTGGYFIDSIEGLDPVKASLVSSDYAQADGAQYRSGRLDPRNIVFKITLEPDYSVESVDSLRQRLYSFFMPKSAVSLRFKMTQRTRDISGIVEDCSIDLFAEKTVATISVMCFDPYFVDPIPVTVTGNSASGTNSHVINNPGSTPVGFKMTIKNTPRTYGFYILQRLVVAPPSSRLNLYGTFQPDDTIIISTVFGQKGITVNRNGVESSSLNAVQTGSTWLTLGIGNNLIQTSADTPGQPYTIEFSPKYGGL